MDIQFPSRYGQLSQLTTRFCNLSISTQHSDIAPRESNTLKSIEMGYEINPGYIEHYNKLYLNRLAILGKRIQFSKVYKIEKVQGQLGVVNVIGIFKRIQVKRVRAFQKNFYHYYENLLQIYHQNDGLEIEDVSGKLKFVLAPGATMNGKEIRSTDLPYGIVIGISGIYSQQKMQFNVKKLTLPSLAPQKLLHHSHPHKDRKILIMSSPSIHQIKIILQQFCQKNWIIQFNEIQSIIIMGFQQKLNAMQYKQLDLLFFKYQKIIDIFVMPNYQISTLYPQKGIHPILFPKSYKQINLISNPQILYINSPNENKLNTNIIKQNSTNSILLSCGQNIKDLIKNCSLGQSSLDIMQLILECSHLAPTCPFSLKCQMMEEDYLVLNQLPHMFIAGECERSGVRDFVASSQGKKVRMIAVGKGKMVVVNVDSFEVQEYQKEDDFGNACGQ